MKFVLFVEGWTEHSVVPRFLKRWLDVRVGQSVAIQSVRFNGNAHYLTEVAKKVSLHLRDANVLAVVGLLDLYGLDATLLNLRFSASDNPATRIERARGAILRRIDHRYRQKFLQHFAVHELEAWLLADPSLFPGLVGSRMFDHPEEVDFDVPPSKVIDRIVRTTRRGDYGYQKTVTGRVLFDRLNPELVYDKCPNFRKMMDEMLVLALAAR